MTLFYPSGLGGTGSELALASPLYVLSDTAPPPLYVDSVTGVDAAAPAGTSRSRPLATIAQANTNSSAGTIIVLLATHNETITSMKTFGYSGVTIIGEGVDSNGRPSASITIQEPASVAGLYLTADYLLIQNVRFKAPTIALTKYMVQIVGQGIEFENCYFEMNEFSDSSAISFGATTGGLRFRGCTFVSTSTTTALAGTPREAISSSAANPNMTLFLNDCVFDGGLTGFKDNGDKPFATDFEANTGTVRVQALGISLLRHANMVVVDEITAWGYVSATAASGGGSLIIVPSSGGGGGEV